MLSEGVEVAAAGAGLLRRGRELLLLEGRGRDLVEQRVEGALVKARAVEVGQALEDLGQQLVVVAGQVRASVVDQQDARRLLVGYLDEGGGELCEAELARGGQDVVSGQHLAALVGHHRAVLAVAAQAVLDGLEVSAARVVRVGAKLLDGDEKLGQGG
jgi:hypothetical protein